MVDYSDPLSERNPYLFSGGLSIDVTPLMAIRAILIPPTPADSSRLVCRCPLSDRAHRLGQERPCQQIMNRPPATRDSGCHCRGSLAVALRLALSTTVDRVGQRLPERLMWTHEVIIGAPPLQM